MLTNSDSKQEANRIADTLLDQELAAAVQIIGPVNSRYRWQNKVHKKREWMVLIKTIDARENEIQSIIKQHHSYELPSILTLLIDSGDSQYLQWILSQSTTK